MLDLALLHKLGHGHGDMINSSFRWTHTKDTIEWSLPKHILCLVRHLAEVEASDFLTADDYIVSAEKTIATASAILQREALTVLFIRSGCRRIVRIALRLAVIARF